MSGPTLLPNEVEVYEHQHTQEETNQNHLA